MKKVVLLTGGGDLPIEVIRKLIKNKIIFYCLIFEKNPVSKLILRKNHKLINFGKIISELLKLQNLGYKYVVLVGNLKRPSIRDINPDFNSAKIISEFAKILLKGGDNNPLPKDECYCPSNTAIGASGNCERSEGEDTNNWCPNEKLKVNNDGCNYCNDGYSFKKEGDTASCIQCPTGQKTLR